MTACRPALLPRVAAALALAACSPDPTSNEPAATAMRAAAASPAVMELGPSLLAYHWQLETAVDAAGQSIASLFPSPENQLGLEFTEGQLGVTGGCNRIGAGYQVVEGPMLQLGPARSTMMGCPPPLAAADAAIAEFLSGTLQAELGGDSSAPALRLVAADGRSLVFKGTPTPETRFGVPGTRAFLEVSPEPCASPADAACITVRDIHYDEQGLKIGSPGEWRALAGGIEGYAPTPGEWQVVRVKRFETAGAAGGEPAVHFVFDMVVERGRP